MARREKKSLLTPEQAAQITEEQARLKGLEEVLPLMKQAGIPTIEHEKTVRNLRLVVDRLARI